MTEIWKDVVDFEGRYQVSSLGQVRSLDREVIFYKNWSRKIRGKILKRSFHEGGYPLVSLWKDGKHYNGLVHQLVAKAFHGPRPPGKDVCHNNGVKIDCYSSNLRYDTPTGNNADKLLHGTSSGRCQSGVKNANAVLDVPKVLLIRAKVLAGEKRRAVSVEFGVSYSLIKQIVRRKVWSHV